MPGMTKVCGASPICREGNVVSPATSFATASFRMARKGVLMTSILSPSI
jgi:hypothetical protein